MEFQNPQINTLFLPSTETIIFEKLDPAYKKIRIYINVIIFSILLLLYLSTGLFLKILFEFPWILLFSIGWSILFGLSILMSIKRYDYEGFAVRDKDIMFKSGIFFRSTLIIPFNRVQHCEIEQGPMDRIFNLSELSLFTAGGSGSDLIIPGLTHEKSSVLKNFITQRVAASGEEE